MSAPPVADAVLASRGVHPTLLALLDYAGVGPADRVAVVLEPARPLEGALESALLEAIRGRGATARVVLAPPFSPRTEEVPPALAAALSEVDVALDFADHESLIHTSTGRRLVREGTLRLAVVALHTRAELDTPFASFPLDRLFARARAAAARLAPGGTARLTTPQGTDLEFEVRSGSVLGMPGGATPAPMTRGVGGFGLFPAGAVGTSPVGARGVLVLDGLVGRRGLLVEPLRLEVEDGFVVRATGGAAGRWLEAQLAAHPGGGFVGKLLVGLHPHGPLEAGLDELDRRKARLSRREGVVLVGLGDARSVGGTVASTWHEDGVLLGPVDLTVGGRPIVRAGSLQALPEVAPLAGPSPGPHQPRLVARTGDLSLFAVEVRGSMPHVHRNPESDEWWLVLEGGPVEARADMSEALVPEGHALLVPRGVPHVAHGPTTGATMLVVERLPWGPAASPAPHAGPNDVRLDVLDLRGLSRAYTPPWSFASRPLLSTDSFVVEAYARPEGMLRPEARTEGPELWLVLRGTLGVELGDAPPSTIAPADHALTLPAGLTCRVVSLHPDTVALRVRAPALS